MVIVENRHRFFIEVVNGRKVHFWTPPPEYWGAVHASSQLSGSHGEWTCSDDVDDGRPGNGHVQGPRRDKLNNRGAKRRGGGGKGGNKGPLPPIGPRIPHRDNRHNRAVPAFALPARCPDQGPPVLPPGPNPREPGAWVAPAAPPPFPEYRAADPLPPRAPEPDAGEPDDPAAAMLALALARNPAPPGGDEEPDPGALQFSDAGHTLAVAGRFSARVRDDATVPVDSAGQAGLRVGEYAARKHQRELRVRANENQDYLDVEDARAARRDLIRKDLAHQQALAHTLTLDARASQRTVEQSRARAAAEAAYLDASRAAYEETRDREAAERTAKAHEARLQHRDLHRLKREMAQEDRDLEFEGRKMRLIEDLRLEVETMTDPLLRRLHTAKLAEEVRRYREDLPHLLEIAHAQNAVAQALEAGKVKDKGVFDDQPQFQPNPRALLVEGDEREARQRRARMPWLDPRNAGCTNARHIDVDLIPGVLFTRHKRPGWVAYMLGGLAYGWKKTVRIRRPDGTLGHANIDPINATVGFGDDGSYHGSLNLLKSDDRRVCRDVLNEYRILGMQSGCLQAILSSGEGFVVEQNFTHAEPVLVHPVLYKQVTLAATGVSITKNQAAAFVREFKKPWLGYIQVGLFHDTVNLAVQHAQIYNFHRNRTIAKTDDVLGDM